MSGDPMSLFAPGVDGRDDEEDHRAITSKDFRSKFNYKSIRIY